MRGLAVRGSSLMCLDHVCQTLHSLPACRKMAQHSLQACQCIALNLGGLHAGVVQLQLSPAALMAVSAVACGKHLGLRCLKPSFGC